MKTYKDNEKILDQIRSKYACKGEIIFKTAIQYVVEEGTNKLNNKDLVGEWLTQIDMKHNEAEAEGKNLFIGRDFEKALIECAVEIAQVNAIDIVKYLQQEWLYGDYTDVTYFRAIELLKYGIGHILQDGLTDQAREELDFFGIEDYELETLGFGDILDEEGDEE